MVCSNNKGGEQEKNVQNHGFPEPLCMASSSHWGHIRVNTVSPSPPTEEQQAGLSTLPPDGGKGLRFRLGLSGSEAAMLDETQPSHAPRPRVGPPGAAMGVPGSPGGPSGSVSATPPCSASTTLPAPGGWAAPRAGPPSHVALGLGCPFYRGRPLSDTEGMVTASS